MGGVKKVERVETAYGTFFTWEDDLLSNQLKEYSAHTRNELAMVLSFLRDGDIVLDVGANIGTFCVPIADRVGERGRVHAFEALPEHFRLLVDNIEANGKGGVVEPHLGIVSDEKYPYRAFTWESGSAHTTFRRDGVDPMEGEVPIEGVGELEFIHLDRFWSEGMGRVRMIKIDTDGHELGIIKSCVNIIQKYKPILYLEVWRGALEKFGVTPEDIEAILKREGYDLFRNIGERNSSHDEFRIARLRSLRDGGDFFDVLAVHPSDDRYPKQYISSLAQDIEKAGEGAKRVLRKVLPGGVRRVLRKLVGRRPG